MINLLPIQKKKQLRTDYTLRFATVLFSIFFAVVIIGNILLLPSYFLSYIKEQAIIEQEALVLKEHGESGLTQFKPLLQELDELLLHLEADQKERKLQAVVSTLLSHRPNGIRITGISYDRDEGKTQVVRLSGVAENREALLILKRDVERDPLFAHVELPVSNLAKDRDIQFAIKVSGTF